MKNMWTRTKEGGSVVPFVVVGVILAIIVVGGIYIVRKQDKTPDKVAVSSPAFTPPQSSQSATTQPAPSQSQTPVPQKSSQPTQNTQSEMPKTGPSDDIAGVLLGASLIGIAVAYGKSRIERYGTLRG